MLVMAFLKVIAWALGTALAGLGIFKLVHVVYERKRNSVAYVGISPTPATAGARLSQNAQKQRF